MIAMEESLPVLFVGGSLPCSFQFHYSTVCLLIDLVLYHNPTLGGQCDRVVPGLGGPVQYWTVTQFFLIELIKASNFTCYFFVRMDGHKFFKSN